MRSTRQAAPMGLFDQLRQPWLLTLIAIGAGVWLMLALSTEAPRVIERRAFQHLSGLHTSRPMERLPLGLAQRVAGAEAARHVERQSQAVVSRLFDRVFEPVVVHYTVQRGGTLEDVANQHGVFHHAITELNPGYGLRQALDPGTRVVIYRHDPEQTSESVGLPWDGALVGGVPMPREGPGRIVYAHPYKAWGTAATIARVDYILRQWAKHYPDSQPLLVGNLSLRAGGDIEPHKSHESGRDVDLCYPQKWDGTSEVRCQDMTAENMDLDENWKLLKLLVETGAVEVIFIDYSLQRLLYDHALERSLMTPEELKRWLQYPDGRQWRDRLIQHEPGHINHLHVRLQCRPGERHCRTGVMP